MCSGFRCCGPALGRQLAQGKRWVPETQLGDLAQPRRQGPETAFALEPADGLELRVRGPAGTLEVGVGGLAGGAPLDISTPASWSTASAVGVPATWSWYRVGRAKAC